ncbi:serine carboxypeptidase-like protein [Tanacetum coccineum]
MLQHYDIRKGSLCYDFSNMEELLSKQSVKEALRVGDIDFVSCSPVVYQDMIMDWMRNLEAGIPYLLEDGIKLCGRHYDIRKGSLCYDFSNMEELLSKQSVKEALGVGDIDFVSCSPVVY